MRLLLLKSMGWGRCRYEALNVMDIACEAMMAAAIPKRMFFNAPFTLDGDLLGIGECDVAGLSEKWLTMCEEIICKHGPNFRASFGQRLDHLEIKFSSDSGVGLGTFYAHGHVVVSTAYLSGQHAASEQEVVSMFVDSLKKVDVVRQAAINEQPFKAMATIGQRPLHVIVVWANPSVAEQDDKLVRELANHFAGAYLCRLRK
jgi:hypothetical protein